MAAKKGAGKARARTAKRPKAEAGSRGLPAAELIAGAPTEAVKDLERAIVADGGAVIGRYRDPVGAHWQVLASLPIGKVEPTPYQRDLSESHVKRLADVIDRLDRFLDPVIAVRGGEGYWTPNGHHRLAALRALGAQAVVALVCPDREVAHRILALNTEKAHALREKSLEVVRLARSLAEQDARPESDLALEFEEPSFLTLGLCYEERGRFSGGAYHPVLRRIEGFLPEPLVRALELRRERAARLLELDDAVVGVVETLKARGFQSPYLKAFVVARVNPLRFQRGATAGFDETLAKMLASAEAFDAAEVKESHLAAASGPPEE